MFFAGGKFINGGVKRCQPAATAAFLATFLVFWLPPEARAGPRLRRSERCLLLCLTSALRFGSGAFRSLLHFTSPVLIWHYFLAAPAQGEIGYHFCRVGGDRAT